MKNFRIQVQHLVQQERKLIENSAPKSASQHPLLNLFLRREMHQSLGAKSLGGVFGVRGNLLEKGVRLF